MWTDGTDLSGEVQNGQAIMETGPGPLPRRTSRTHHPFLLPPSLPHLWLSHAIKKLVFSQNPISTSTPWWTSPHHPISSKHTTSSFLPSMFELGEKLLKTLSGSWMELTARKWKETYVHSKTKLAQLIHYFFQKGILSLYLMVYWLYFRIRLSSGKQLSAPQDLKY